ncbi:large terminase [Citrobacter sp. MGH110]|nr:large terminase [Citrobacter sp. MGH110]
MRHFVRAGLRSLFRPEPQTAVEWADANHYLPKESAYQEGRWETLPFQRAIMNAMGSDYIREVNVVKSARVGYSKMLLGVYAYFIEHKQRNTLIWLPTDGDAENFMKTHVEPTIRDIPSLLALAPWYGKKHRDNTLTMKRFTNGRGFWCLGGKAAKNYREKSVDVAGYDELAAFDDDIEQEGSPTFLGDKRIEGSVWPKSIRGSTPKVRGTCQIERAASESPHFMRFMLPARTAGRSSILNLAIKRRRLASNGRRMIPPVCFISASIMPASSGSRNSTSLMPVISAKRPGSGPVMAFAGFRLPVKKWNRRTV